MMFMGYIDAATVEEGVKLIAARGKACCCWAMCKGVPGFDRCHPCCYPGWRKYKTIPNTTWFPGT